MWETGRLPKYVRFWLGKHRVLEKTTENGRKSKEGKIAIGGQAGITMTEATSSRLKLIQMSIDSKLQRLRNASKKRKARHLESNRSHTIQYSQSTNLLSS